MGNIIFQLPGNSFKSNHILIEYLQYTVAVKIYTRGDTILVRFKCITLLS